MPLAPQMPDPHAQHAHRHLVLIVASAAVVLLLCIAAVLGYIWQQSAQTAVPTMRTVLIVRNPPSLDIVWDHAKAQLEALGYHEGENIRYVSIEIGTDLASTETRIEEALDAQHIDLIYAMGIVATRASKEVTAAHDPALPVVFAVVSDPVGSGLVESMQSSGNNLTGVTPSNEFAAAKRLEFLQEMLPESKRIIYAWNDENTSGVKLLRSIAPGLGFELIEERVSDVSSMVAFVDGFAYKKGDAVLRASDGMGGGAISGLVDAALRHKVPLIGTNDGDTKRGALMSYGADYPTIANQTAHMVDRVFKGEQPSTIPVQEASEFGVAVNTDTARSIGVMIPQTFLLKVKHVYPE